MRSKQKPREDESDGRNDAHSRHRHQRPSVEVEVRSDKGGVYYAGD